MDCARWADYQATTFVFDPKFARWAIDTVGAIVLKSGTRLLSPTCLRFLRSLRRLIQLNLTRLKVWSFASEPHPKTSYPHPNRIRKILNKLFPHLIPFRRFCIRLLTASGMFWNASNPQFAHSFCVIKSKMDKRKKTRGWYFISPLLAFVQWPLVKIPSKSLHRILLYQIY